MSERRLVLTSLAGALLSLSHPLRAQERIQKARVGILGTTAIVGSADRTLVLRSALRDLGWVEGRNIGYETRWVGQSPERYAQGAAELLALGVDVIVTGGVTITNAARHATSTIPIVFIGAADPVKFGLVASLARPGANVTGIAIPPLDWGKFLELARDAVPGAKKIGLIANPANLTYADYLAQNEASAKNLGLTLQVIPVKSAEELPNAFAEMKRESAAALVFGPDGVYYAKVGEILERARANRLPVIAPFLFAAELGALAAYGSDPEESERRAADYVDRILRGAKPADLPVQQPDRFKLIINLKAAAALNITVPRSLQLRASELIE